MNVLACAFCLSSERNLFFMDEWRFHLIISLFDDDNVQYMKYLQSAGGLRACWCCQARVRSIQRFASSARRSLDALREHLAAATQVTLTSQSSLCQTALDAVDIPPLLLKPEPQSSQLVAKDEPQAQESIVCELVQLPTAVKLETDTSDREYSDTDLTKQENDVKTKTSRNAVQHTKKAKDATKKKTVRKKMTQEVSKAVWATEQQARSWYECELATDGQVTGQDTGQVAGLDAGQDTGQVTEQDAGQVAGQVARHVCGLCRRAFSCEEDREKHFGECHDETIGPYECDICRYRFASRRRLRAHVTSHFARHACAACPYVSRARRDVTRHHAAAHAHANDAFVCMRCKESFTTALERRTHRRGCHTYVCDAPPCARAFTNVSTYYDHRATHREGAMSDLYCHVCDKQFTSSKWFKTHFRTSLKHVSRDSYKHECPHCKLRFHIAQRLKEHVAAKHMHRGLYACDLCNKSFSINKTLKKHRARVHNIGSVPPPARDKVCEHCGKAFTSTLFLNDHMRIHTGEKPFKCTLCPAAFAQNGTLYIHTLAAHKKKLGKDGLTDSPSYQCAECGKQFPSVSRMRTHHNSVHLKLSRHACDTCHATFSSATSLKNHLAGRHGLLSSDALNCDTCGKLYNTSTALRAHSKRHLAAKREYKCRACAAHFKTSSGLQLHFKYVHLKLKRNDKVSLKNVGDPDKELLVNGQPQSVT